jgi:hypothetical protein
MAPASGERRAAGGNHGRTPGIFKSPSEAPGDKNKRPSSKTEIKDVHGLPLITDLKLKVFTQMITSSCFSATFLLRN